MSASDVFGRLDSAVVSYSRSTKVTWEKGRGHKIFDASGKSYLDFLSGCGALNYGHNDPDMRDALVSYITDDGITMGMDFFFEAKAGFLESFERHILQPRGLDYRLQFTGPTGTNAVEAAIKIARKYTNKANIISFTNGFHGCTLGALALTANEDYRASFQLGLSGTHRLPFDGYAEGVDSAALFDRMLKDGSSGLDNTAAVIFESVQGEGGLNVASKQWAQKIESICRAHGILIIVDDIQTGCGRTGPFFSFESLGITPDIVTMSKAISGFGLPLALTLIRPDVDVWSPGEHTGTFRGNAHACITGKVMLDKFWSDGQTPDRTATLATIIETQLQDLAGKYGLRKKGRGFLQGLNVGCGVTARKVQTACFSKGLLLECCGPEGEIIKLLPPLTIPQSALEAGLGILRDAVIEVIDAGPVTKTASRSVVSA